MKQCVISCLLLATVNLQAQDFQILEKIWNNYCATCQFQCEVVMKSYENKNLQETVSGTCKYNHQTTVFEFENSMMFASPKVSFAIDEEEKIVAVNENYMQLWDMNSLKEYVNSYQMHIRNTSNQELMVQTHDGLNTMWIQYDKAYRITKLTMQHPMDPYVPDVHLPYNKISILIEFKNYQKLKNPSDCDDRKYIIKKAEGWELTARYQGYELNY